MMLNVCVGGGLYNALVTVCCDKCKRGPISRATVQRICSSVVVLPPPDASLHAQCVGLLSWRSTQHWISSPLPEDIVMRS